jgi:hypothetical protein
VKTGRSHVKTGRSHVKTGRSHVKTGRSHVKNRTFASSLGEGAGWVTELVDSLRERPRITREPADSPRAAGV